MCDRQGELEARRDPCDSPKLRMDGTRLWPRSNVTRHHEPKPRCRLSRAAAPGPHRCTPPDVLVRDHGRWQVSWLAGLCLAPPSRLPSGVIGARLAAYSCGGSHGIGVARCEDDGLTVFPFDPRREPSPTMVPRFKPTRQYQSPRFTVFAIGALEGHARLWQICRAEPGSPPSRTGNLK